MKILNAEGDVDLDGLVAELDATARVSNTEVRRDMRATISAAALLDIAASLRILAEESAAAYQNGYADTATGEILEPLAQRDGFAGIEPGDLVHVLDDTAPGEVMKLGDDEGEAWAEVDFGAGFVARYYLRNLARLEGDDRVPPADSETEGNDMDEGEELEETDLESDFATPDADEPATDPLEALKAATGGKKGKKK